jgi:regulator of sigma E protease
MVLTFVSFIIVLGILVFIHEFGHYITAKKSDIMVSEFALGFGPKIISRQWGETVYSLRIIPLGGFCNMVGEFPADETMPESEQETYQEAKTAGRLFTQKAAWKRFAVIFMGPVMNFLLALIIFILAFTVFGIPVQTEQGAILGEIIPEQPAARAGLQPNDKILAIDDQKVNSWSDMASIIASHPAEKITISYQRNGQISQLEVMTRADEEDGRGVIGVYPRLVREQISPFKAIKLGAYQTYYVFKMTILGFVQIFKDASTKDLGGPIMIASIIGQAARTGLLNVMTWTAVISINLGIINLLPFPALDGGRILFIIIELLRGKPVDPKKESYVHMIGFAVLIVLMIFIVYQDVMRSFFN